MKSTIKFFALFACMLGALSLSAQQKFGHVNTQELFYAMPEVKTVQKQLETKGKEYEKQLTTMYTQYETLAKEIQEKGKTMMQAVLEAKYNELQQLEERIVLLEEKAQKELQAYEAKLLEPIEAKAFKAIQDVATANGYTYVIDSSLGVFLILPDADDLTAKVKTKLGIQ
jgi:outer membrane protein